MSKMLSLPFHAWLRARSRADGSRQRLEQVVAMADLPAEELALAHRMLAEHCVRAGHFAKARSQLRSALRLNPNCAATSILLARAWEDDPYGSDRKAASAYRRATKLDANSAIAWAALGRACVRINGDAIAIKSVRRAIQLAPADESVLTIVVDALREMGKLKAALRIATRARFRNPKSKVIRELGDRVRFEMARVARKKCGSTTSVGAINVLPFVRVIGCDGHRRTVRLDGASHPMPASIRFRHNG